MLCMHPKIIVHAFYNLCVSEILSSIFVFVYNVILLICSVHTSMAWPRFLPFFLPVNKVFLGEVFSLLEHNRGFRTEYRL